jgi:hypothetical protein
MFFALRGVFANGMQTARFFRTNATFCDIFRGILAAFFVFLADFLK